MASETAKGRRIAKTLRKHHAKARQIVKKEHVPYRTARKIARDAHIETFVKAIRRGGRKAKIWVRVTPFDKTGFWKKVDVQDLPKIRTFEDAQKMGKGKRVEFEIVRRSTASYQYWALVERTAKLWKIPQSKARELLARMKQEMTRTARLHRVRRTYRVRDAAAVLEYSDRYQNVRMEFGI